MAMDDVGFQRPRDESERERIVSLPATRQGCREPSRYGPSLGRAPDRRRCECGRNALGHVTRELQGVALGAAVDPDSRRGRDRVDRRAGLQDGCMGCCARSAHLSGARAPRGCTKRGNPRHAPRRRRVVRSPIDGRSCSSSRVKHDLRVDPPEARRGVVTVDVLASDVVEALMAEVVLMGRIRERVC